MSERIVVGFDDPLKADRAPAELVHPEREYSVGLGNAAIVTRRHAVMSISLL